MEDSESDLSAAVEAGFDVHVYSQTQTVPVVDLGHVGHVALGELRTADPLDPSDHDSLISDLSSIDLLPFDTLPVLVPVPAPYRILQMETVKEGIVLSSHQRRTQRRQWSPSIHQSSGAPTHHPSDDLIPTSLAVEYRLRFLGERVGLDVEVDPKTVLGAAAGTTSCENRDLESGDYDSHPVVDTHFSPCKAATAEKESDHVDASGSSVTESNVNMTAGACSFTKDAAPDSKYDCYECLVDASQNDKSLEIHVYSMKRPHMRSFHLAWMAFFVAFFTWFSITPLLFEVQRSLDMTDREIWTSSSFAVAGSAVTRILIGPICDKYGARWSMAGTLVVSAIPTALTGLVQSATSLYILRLFIGVAGCAFVACQYWTSTLFIAEVAGTANALAAGWGNLGGGVTQIVMGSIVFPLFKKMYGDEGSATVGEEGFDRASDFAWRAACVVPAFFCLVMAFVVVKYSDDSPKGNYKKRKRQGNMPAVSTTANIKVAASNLNTWILFVQYGCCFGVEITMINACALYFHTVFGLSTESAAAIASIFGWMNLFARGVGGFVSDLSNSNYGIRGRLGVQVVLLLFEGVFVIFFGHTQSLAMAICAMVILSVFVQASEGSTYGIVPYISPSVTGSIAGIVGAGGNVGGVAFSLVFREFSYATSFTLMGAMVMTSALVSFGFILRGHATLCIGGDSADVVRRRDDYNASVGNTTTPPPLSSTSNVRTQDICR